MAGKHRQTSFRCLATRTLLASNSGYTYMTLSQVPPPSWRNVREGGGAYKSQQSEGISQKIDPRLINWVSEWVSDWLSEWLFCFVWRGSHHNIWPRVCSLIKSLLLVGETLQRHRPEQDSTPRPYRHAAQYGTRLSRMNATCIIRFTHSTVNRYLNGVPLWGAGNLEGTPGMTSVVLMAVFVMVNYITIIVITGNRSIGPKPSHFGMTKLKNKYNTMLTEILDWANLAHVHTIWILYAHADYTYKLN